VYTVKSKCIFLVLHDASRTDIKTTQRATVIHDVVPLLLTTSLCSATYVRWQRGTARIRPQHAAAAVCTAVTDRYFLHAGPTAANLQQRVCRCGPIPFHKLLILCGQYQLFRINSDNSDIMHSKHNNNNNDRLTVFDPGQPGYAGTRRRNKNIPRTLWEITADFALVIQHTTTKLGLTSCQSNTT